MVSFQYVINMKIVKKIFFVILNLWNSVCSLYLQHISIRPHFKCSTTALRHGYHVWEDRLKGKTFRNGMLKFFLQVYRCEDLGTKNLNKVDDHVLTQVTIPLSE